MQLYCRTNLDLLPAEKWPTELPAVPRVGDFIESDFTWGVTNARLVLEVVRVTWKAGYHIRSWIPEIELHLPKGRFENMHAFYEWYGTITGKGKSFFI